MINLKKIVLAFAVCTIMATTNGVAFGNEEISVPIMVTGSSENSKSTQKTPQKAPKTITYRIETLEVNLSNGKVSSILGKDNNGISRLFIISKETIIMDNENGIPTNVSEIKKRDIICVIASRIESKSNPPQSVAVAVLTNLKEKGPAIYIKVGRINIAKSGIASIMNDDGRYIVTIDKDTVLLPYKTRNRISVNNIRNGSELLVWADLMTSSIPAKMVPHRVVLFPSKKQLDKIVINTLEKVISINGTELEYDKDTELFYRNDNGVLMVPLRIVAQKLGYQISWNKKSIILSKGDKKAKLKINKKEYFINGKVIECNDVPELIRAVAFVPITVLKELLEVEFEINDGQGEYR